MAVLEDEQTIEGDPLSTDGEGKATAQEASDGSPAGHPLENLAKKV